MDKDEIRFALEDARLRQNALLDLIYFNERQALGMLRLYAVLGPVLGAGAYQSFLTEVYAIAWAALAATVVFVIGSILCLNAMSHTKITLPGRYADFWHDVMTKDSLNFEGAANHYLQELSAAQASQKEFNRKSAISLAQAKWTIVLAPLAAIVAALISLA